MMKITFCNSSETAVLKVEGKLAGPWVDELEKTWKDIKPMTKAENLRVDLCAVTYVDAEGRHLLEQMHKAGVDLVGDGIMTRYMIEKIKHDNNGHKSNGHKSNGHKIKGHMREGSQNENASRIGAH